MIIQLKDFDRLGFIYMYGRFDGIITHIFYTKYWLKIIIESFLYGRLKCIKMKQLL